MKYNQDVKRPHKNIFYKHFEKENANEFSMITCIVIFISLILKVMQIILAKTISLDRTFYVCLFFNLDKIKLRYEISNYYIIVIFITRLFMTGMFTTYYT